ncbi:MAG: hypothetical protein ACAI18_00335 [Gemmatimonadales bacterium]
MSDAHWHLIVSHLPVLGVPFGAALLAAGLWRKNVTLQRTALVVLLLAGLAAGVAFLTGEPAEHMLENMAGRPESLIESHEEAALAVTIATGVLAFIAATALWLLRRGVLRRGWGLGTMVLAIGVSVALAWVATLGGRISHPEVRPGEQVYGANSTDD